MSYNTNLIKAKQAKNDEFYTRYEDIEAELSHYSVDYFKDKVIYCPCDVGVEGLDVPKSNFIKYFENNKEKIGYRKLIHTSLQEGYDFRSDYCQNLFKEADIVVTNPPFSLFRDFVNCLERFELKYLIIGNMNAITYREIFPLFKNNKMWVGSQTGCISMYYKEPYKTQLKHFRNTCWFTNLDLPKRHVDLLLVKEYNEKDYAKFDELPNVINVDKLDNIPNNYYGYMGVPITYLYKHNPDQFEILDIINTYLICDYFGLNKYIKEKHSHGCNINGKTIYKRILIRRK